jgi:hypothetical protein
MKARPIAMLPIQTFLELREMVIEQETKRLINEINEIDLILKLRGIWREFDE